MNYFQENLNNIDMNNDFSQNRQEYMNSFNISFLTPNEISYIINNMLYPPKKLIEDEKLDKLFFSNDITVKPSDTNEESSSDIKQADFTSSNCPKKSTKEYFSIKIYQKRGRPECVDNDNKSHKLLKKKHSRDDFDNVQTKVQVHFINFLINLVNDAIRVVFGNCNAFFKHIDYHMKKKVNHEYINEILHKPIKFAICQNVSKKYKKFQNEYNKKLCDELTKKSKWLSEFLELKYIEVFNKYYYNEEKPLKSIDFNGKKIMILEKTKSFYYLLEKEKEIKNKIINVTQDVFLYTKNKSNTFTITKNNN